MGAISMRVHSVGNGQVPATRVLRYADGQTFGQGAILIWSAGSVVVGGSDPTDIVGIALQGAATNPGYDAANSPSVITGRNQTVTVCIPNQTTIFAANLTNSSSTLVTPAQADVGVQYGVTAYSGKWTVDKGNTADRVEVVGFDTSVYGGIVFFKFLDSVLSGE